jgi:hypothetical protein
MELSPAALYLAKEQCRLTVLAGSSENGCFHPGWCSPYMTVLGHPFQKSPVLAAWIIRAKTGTLRSD